MKISDIEDADKLVTKDYLDVVIGRLENKIDAHFNAIDAKFNNQKTLIIVAIVSVIAQIVNAWILHGK